MSPFHPCRCPICYCPVSVAVDVCLPCKRSDHQGVLRPPAKPKARRERR